MDTTKVKIETKRLLLVPIEKKYREDIFREHTKEISQYLLTQPTGNIKDTDNFIKKSIKEMKEGNNFQLVVFDKKTKEFLGCVGLHSIDSKTPKMGIWLKKTAHGKKYGREAMKGMKDWADEHLEYDHIKYLVAKENIPSKKIAESLGGKLVDKNKRINSEGDEDNGLEYWIFK